MAYLVAAYGVVWAGTFLYLMRLARGERRLQQEIERLQACLGQSEPSGTDQ